MYNSDTTSWQEVRAAFKTIWGYDDFRPPQGEIIRSLLEKHDALIVMPTGGGKSICFQLPALLQNGFNVGDFAFGGADGKSSARIARSQVASCSFA
jgi:ATP-dependent DNA helicase RecQ